MDRLLRAFIDAGLTATQAQIISDAIEEWLLILSAEGSKAAPGFMRPEGVIVYHEAARVYFKKTLEKDDEPKGARQ